MKRDKSHLSAPAKLRTKVKVFGEMQPNSTYRRSSPIPHQWVEIPNSVTALVSSNSFSFQYFLEIRTLRLLMMFDLAWKVSMMSRIFHWYEGADFNSRVSVFFGNRYMFHVCFASIECVCVCVVTGIFWWCRRMMKKDRQCRVRDIIVSAILCESGTRHFAIVDSIRWILFGLLDFGICFCKIGNMLIF